MKFDVIVADPPWSFNDKLKMSAVKRGVDLHYPLLNSESIKCLRVDELASEPSVLALWVPSSHIKNGLDTTRNWGFTPKQTWIWVKTKNDPFVGLKKELKKSNDLFQTIDHFDINNVLSFNMGHTFRQTHEICIIATKGTGLSKIIENRSQRSVFLGPAKKHSEKPESLQNSLDAMFPNANKLEMFARRKRKGWTCVGNQCPGTINEDIRESIERIMTL